MTDPGNSFQTAQRITPGLTPQVFRDAVQFGDEDFYTFSVSRSSSLQLVLSGLNGDANVEIYRQVSPLNNQIYTDPNNIEAVSLNGGSLPELISVELQPGTYFIRVLPGPAVDPTDLPGTTPQTSYNLSVAVDNGLRSDLVWRNYSTGQNVSWLVEGAQLQSIAPLNSAFILSYQIQATGDFNGDGQADIVWRNVATGENVIWLMNGTTLTQIAALPTVPNLNWQIAGAGDFNNDGRTDIVWRNYATGENIVWLMDIVGGQPVRASNAVLPFEPNLGLRIQGVGDFNGDGRPDLLWRGPAGPAAPNGTVFAWFMNGVNRIGDNVRILEPATPTFQIQGTGDFNGDGLTDIFWRDVQTGANEFWLMDGVQRQAVVPTAPVLPVWQATAPFNRQVEIELADFAGNTQTTPFQIGVLNGNGVFTGSVGGDDTDDYYRFSLGSLSELNIALQGIGGPNLSGDLDLQLLTDGGAIIEERLSIGPTGETISGLQLSAGNYLIRVFPKPGESSLYRLAINVNSFPVTVSTGPLIVSEGAAATIDSSLLLVTDDNDFPSQITYSVVALPDHGELLLDGSALVSGGIFTQADINTGRLSYRNGGSEAALDRFTFTVQDSGTPVGTIAETTFSIGIIPVNDPPTLTLNTGATVNEGAVIAIANTALGGTDVEQGPAQLIYTLEQLPQNGTLTLNLRPITAVGATFTQADINSSGLLYSHNGTETLSDSFVFSLTDGAGGTALPTPSTFSLTVTPVNDAPVLLTNTGFSVDEDATQAITQAVLQTSDAELSPIPGGNDQIIYRLTVVPTNGILEKDGTGPLGVGSFFTQADIDNGRLTYTQDGSQEANSDRFSFTIEDDQALQAVGGPFTFNIAINPINTPPRVTLSAGVTVDEGSSTAINATVLGASDPDGPRPITYTLVDLPNTGQLVLGATTLGAGGSFTQTDLNNGLLTYVHNGAEPASAPGNTDRFTFRVADAEGATSALTSFTLTVNEVNDAPTLTVPEAQNLDEDTQIRFSGSRAITVSDPDSPDITLTITATNGTGVVSVSGIAPSNSITFNGSAANLTTRLNTLVYRPDPNYFGPESITIIANDGEGGITQNTINLTVQPINDPPTLVLPVGTQTVLEDTPLILSITTDDIDAGTSTVRAILSALNGTLTLNPGAAVTVIEGADGSGNLTIEGTIDQISLAIAALTYQGNPDYFGSDQVTIRVDDQGATGAPGPRFVEGTIPITVTPVNDPPSFVGGPNITVDEADSTNVAKTFQAWATQISRGAANESNQTLFFDTLNVSNPSIFATGGQPRVDPNTGNLTFTLLPDAFGTTEVTIRLRDSGPATPPPNDNTSEDFTFTITVNSVNDPPFFNIPNRTIQGLEDTPFSGLLATQIRPGPNLPPASPFSESDQTLTFIIESNTNPGLFEVGPAIAANGTLSFTPAQDANGQAILTVRLQDNGGIENGGVDTSALQTFTINVQAVNDAPVLTIPATPFTVDEDQLLNITGVSVEDVDAGNGIIEVTLTAQGPGGATNAGNITITNPAGATISGNSTASVRLTGTLAQINAALGSFNYLNRLNINGEERIVIRVDDRGNTGGPAQTDIGTLTINVTSINDPPTLTISNIVRSPLEDTVFNLTGITVSDVDAGNNPIQVTLSTLQPGGRLFFANTTNLTAIEGDIVNGSERLVVQGTVNAFRATGLPSLRYQGALNFNGPDEVLIEVNDLGNVGNGGPGIVTGVVSLNVQAVNDLPELTLPTGPIEVNEDTLLNFTGVNSIFLTDVDSGDTPIRLSLRVNNGNLNLDTTGLTLINGLNNSPAATYEAPVETLINALATLTYLPNLNYFGGDVLTVTVNDRGATGLPGGAGIDITRTVNISVLAVDDPPVLLRNNTLLVNEGAIAQVIPTGLLDATDVDGPLPTFQVESLPTNGTLLINNVAATVGATFTRTQLQGNQIRYTHNGSETTSDGFGFTLVGDPTAGTRTFNITVNPINDPPVLTLNNPLTVDENNSGTVVGNLRDLLGVSDPDSNASQIRYVLQAVPSSGTLSRFGPLTVGSSFTQADINSGNVTYRHNGSETTSDSFVFRVVDDAGNTTNSTVFSININPINDPPVIVSNGPITLSEGAITSIGASRLLTTDPENQTPVTYTLRSVPLNGQLVLNGTTVLSVGSTFTQGNINSGQLSYRHDGSETTADGFDFEVADTPLPAGPPLIRTGRFNIVVTPVNDPPILLTPNPSFTIEGSVESQTTIGADLLQVTDVDNSPNEITFTLLTAPTVGQLRLNGLALGQGGRFTQADIFAGNLTYFYDGVGAPGSDSFRFNADDGAGGTVATTFFNIFFAYND